MRREVIHLIRSDDNPGGILTWEGYDSRMRSLDFKIDKIPPYVYIQGNPV